MHTYTVVTPTGEAIAHGLSAEDAAEEVLSHDGRLWRMERDPAGGWRLLTSAGSAASHSGAGKMGETWSGNRPIWSPLDAEEAAWADIAMQVLAARWPHAPTVMTDAEFEAIDC